MYLQKVYFCQLEKDSNKAAASAWAGYLLGKVDLKGIYKTSVFLNGLADLLSQELLELNQLNLVLYQQLNWKRDTQYK